MAAYVLVHSPLTGPSPWLWVAAQLTARGHRVLVPAAPAASTWQQFTEAVAAQAARQRDAVLVGHSGAGPLLPQIAARVGARRLVFVDAGVPPDQGEAELMPAEIMTELRKIAIDGLLPPWSEWFGPDAMRELVPDADRRALITAELPRVPLAYFETRVPVPPGWAAAGGGYVLLSEAYAAEADAAAARGWPVVRRQGRHLDLVTKPDEVAEDIVSV